MPRPTMTMPGRATLALAALLAAAACSGGTKKKVKKPDHSSSATTADQFMIEARAAAKAGDVTTADAKYLEAEKLDLKLEIVKEHVEFLLAHGKTDGAVAVAKAYYEAKPSDSNGSLVYANALIGASDFTTAIEIASEVVELQSTNPAAYNARGRALVGAGKADQAIDDLRKATELEPQNEEFQLAYGIGLEKNNNIDEAALILRSLAKKHQDQPNPRVLVHLGVLSRAQDEIKEGMGYLQQATLVDPNMAEAWYNLALAQNDYGDNYEAEISAAKAATLEPNNGQYQYVYGEMLRINKKPDEAKAAYQKALDARPPAPKAAAKMASVLYEAGQYAEAEVFLTDMIGKDPTIPGLYYNLGWVYSAQKKYKLGVDAFEKYLAIAPKEDKDRAKATAEIKSLKKKGGLK